MACKVRLAKPHLTVVTQSTTTLAYKDNNNLQHHWGQWQIWNSCYVAVVDVVVLYYGRNEQFHNHRYSKQLFPVLEDEFTFCWFLVPLHFIWMTERLAFIGWMNWIFDLCSTCTKATCLTLHVNTSHQGMACGLEEM